MRKTLQYQHGVFKRSDLAAEDLMTVYGFDIDIIAAQMLRYFVRQIKTPFQMRFRIDREDGGLQWRFYTTEIDDAR